MNPDLLYQLCLCETPHIGHVHAKILVDHFPTAKDIFDASVSSLERIEGIGEVRARAIKQFRDFKKAESEIDFIEKRRITPLFLKDKSYPQRLLNCYDPPTLLFYLGSADLNASRIVSVVGTRNPSDYGKRMVDRLVKDLSDSDVTIVSGLAYGIDAVAHQSALRNNLHTIGVVGHGLDTIYPSQHAGLAREMLNAGGLLTEFRSQTQPDKYNFPSRNRIVAGMADAVIIVESGIRGGSMITADLAAGYHRDVFAIPGRLTDAKSAGCHELIRHNKAMLLTGAAQLREAMGWEEINTARTVSQTALFIELSDPEKKIIDILGKKGSASIDEINFSSGVSAGAVATAVLRLEMEHLLERLPGKIYRLTP